MNEPSVIPAVRDLAIIFLALESIVVLVLLSILIVQIRSLVILLNEEIKPMLEATQETADTVRNTTTFFSKRVSKPFVDVISFGAGVRQAAKTVKEQIVPSRNGETTTGLSEAPPAKTSEDESPPPSPPPPSVSDTSGGDLG